MQPRRVHKHHPSAVPKERIEEAKRDWKEGHFPKVPGDETEFIPLLD
jgi:hypothetical protein